MTSLVKIIEKFVEKLDRSRNYAKKIKPVVLKALVRPDKIRDIDR